MASEARLQRAETRTGARPAGQDCCPVCGLSFDPAAVVVELDLAPPDPAAPRPRSTRPCRACGRRSTIVLDLSLAD